VQSKTASKHGARQRIVVDQTCRARQDVLKVGDEIDAMVLEIKRDEQKSPSAPGNSKPIVDARPEESIRPAEDHRQGANLTNFGAVRRSRRRIDGMVHISDMSWTAQVTNPADILKKARLSKRCARSRRRQPAMYSGLKNRNRSVARNRQTLRMGISSRASRQARDFGAFIELPDNSKASSTSARSRRAHREDEGRAQVARKSTPASSRSTSRNAASA